jgi:hypothetical protein
MLINVRECVDGRDVESSPSCGLCNCTRGNAGQENVQGSTLRLNSRRSGDAETSSRGGRVQNVEVIQHCSTRVSDTERLDQR